MTLRKISIDKSVSYVKKGDQLHREKTPPFSEERMETASNIKTTQKNKRVIGNLTGEGFKINKG